MIYNDINMCNCKLLLFIWVLMQCYESNYLGWNKNIVEIQHWNKSQIFLDNVFTSPWALLIDEPENFQRANDIFNYMTNDPLTKIDNVNV